MFDDVDLDIEVDETRPLRLAVEAIQRGDNVAGQKLLVQVIRANPRNETAWLWLATTLDDPAKVRECLERVLKIDPSNDIARRRLERLNRSEAPRLESEPAPSAPQPQPSPPAFQAVPPAAQPPGARVKRPTGTLALALGAVFVISCLFAGYRLYDAMMGVFGGSRSRPTPTWTPVPPAIYTPESAPIHVEGILWCPDCAAKDVPINLWERGSANGGRIAGKAYHGDRIEVLDRSYDLSERRYYYFVIVVATDAGGWVPETRTVLSSTVTLASTPVPMPTASSMIVRSLSEFEASHFCGLYHCRLEESSSHDKGGVRNVYDVDVRPQVGVEISTVDGVPVAFDLTFYDRRKLSSSDRELMYSFLRSIHPGTIVDARTQDLLVRNIEVDVFQICEAYATPFGSVRIWAGKVAQQRVYVGTSCP